MKLPTLEEMNLLHKKYAPTLQAFERVWKHSHIVRRIALQVADNRYSTDRELIKTGALLHDIGVYKLYHNGKIDEINYIKHGILGYELLKEEGFDESVCRFAMLHTGVGITKEDIQNNNLPLPVRDYVAETDEERIVMYADKFHSKSEPSTFNSTEWYKKHLAEKLGQEKLKLFEELVNEYGEPELEGLVTRYGHPLR